MGGGEAGKIYRIDSKGRVEEVARLSGFCGGLAVSPQYDLFVCNPGHGGVRERASDQQDVFASKSEGGKLIEPNFSIFDQSGNLYVTDSGAWKGSIGRLLRFHPQGAGTEIAGGFGYANGLPLSEDEGCIFVAEIDTRKICRISLEKGESASNRVEVYAESPGAVPDSLALDRQGNL